ncbi:MAG: choline dehydrogenase-like flavoprotein, partial [Parasphingorhabdus sp.]
PAALQAGAVLKTGARVSRILLNNKGLANGALYEDRDGNTHKIEAEVVILAGHAIGSTRLLLKSANTQFPDGLANSSGQVGRNLMMHPLARVVGLFDEDMTSWQGHWGQSIYSMEFAETRPEHDFVRGGKWNLAPTGGPLTAATYPTDGEPVFGEALHHRVSDWLGRSALWGITAEDLPEAHNRLLLDKHERDEDGDGLPRLVYKTSANSHRMLKFMLERVKQSFAEAGVTNTLQQSFAPDAGWHPLGTCRMGKLPNSSVVNEWNQCHDIANLYIVDGSTFVTSSSVNPAATIAALARRAVDKIIVERGSIQRAVL